MRSRSATGSCRSTLAASCATGLCVLLTSALVRAADPAAATSASEVAVKPAAVHEVSQRNKKFAPGTITVEAGDEVVFLNDDDISHNVFSRSADSKFNLTIQRPGEHKSYRFETPGKSVVRCAIHPKMKLVVNVVEPEAEPDASPRAAETAVRESHAQAPAAPDAVAP